MTRYQDPVTDRVLADVTGRTAKGFMNVADWNRIMGNYLVAARLVIALGGTPFTPPDYPGTTSMVPTGGQVYALARANYTLPYYSKAPGLDGNYGIEMIDPFYKYGVFATRGLTHLDVNYIEDQIDKVMQNAAAFYSFSSWVADEAHPVRRPRAGVGECGTGLTRQNGFVKYA